MPLPCNGFGFWWIFPLIFGAFWLLVISTLLWRSHWFGHAHHFGDPDAKAVLRERFARGDIDADEYQRRLGVLEGR